MSKLVTFYSYKGGVGRTFLLANVAVLLAKWGLRVLCVDWDLEAPGLMHYFRRTERSRLRAGGKVGAPVVTYYDLPDATGGIVDIVAAVNGKEPVHWRDFVLEAAGEDWKLHVLPAGSPGDDYVKEVHKLDWNHLYDNCNLGWHLEEIRNQWIADYDIVLVDSRTGLTDIGGICTAQLPDILVLLSSATRQSLEGCLDVVERAKHARDRLPIPRPAPLVLPLVSRFDDREEYDEAKRWLELFESSWAPFFEVWAPSEVDSRELLGLLRIPYVSKWSFGERLPAQRERIDDPGLISWFIANVAACLAQGLGGTGLLVSNRNAYIERVADLASQNSSPGKRHYDVFISYQRPDASLARDLHEQLAKRHISTFLDQYEIMPGDLLEPVLEQAISASRLIVFLVSTPSSSFVSNWQEQEISIALSLYRRGRTRIVPIYVGDRTPAMAPPRISQFHGITTDGPMDTVADALALLVDKERSDPGL